MSRPEPAPRAHAPSPPSEPNTTPSDPAPGAREPENDDVWGFRDTRFRINARGHVEMTGSRYPLCGQELQDLLPWVREVFDVPVEAADVEPFAFPPPVPTPRECASFRAALEKVLPPEALSVDPGERLRHGHGHTLAEMYAIKRAGLARVPDLVLYPREERHVEEIVAAACTHGVCLIPYGGGTNVTEALLCPESESRPIASVDLRFLDQILWIDPHDGTACIQAGAVGGSLLERLRARGYTLGHEPDSLEHSTLGGWIATYASGMKKNRYGNIEDLVLDLRVVTASGVVEKRGAVPRESIGMDPRRWIFGSEGNLGIITRAVVKVFPLPEVQTFESALFPDFASGLRFLYALARRGPLPCSVRLLDNLQFQLSHALRSPARPTAAARRALERLYVTRVKGFDPQRMAACTFVFEGTRREVRAQKRAVSELVREHGGMLAGATNGARGYQLTFSIAYLRDFVLNHFIAAESFETSVPWSKLPELCTRVVERLRREHAERGLPGRAFASVRVTQVYHSGACAYFYFAFQHKGVEDPVGVYTEIESAAREEVLRCGGSLSHHHGVGKIRQRFLPEIHSPPALESIEGVKRALDPGNVFGAGNLWRA